jgi:pyruvate dehydrogenase E1 component
VGLEQPRCVAWEPAWGQDLEWILLHALGQLGRVGGTSAYLRLSTRPVEQSSARLPEDPAAREERRRQVLAGGYRLRESAGTPEITLVGMGVIMTELLAAADLLFRALQTRQGLYDGDERVLEELFPPERTAPIVSVLDGHPHTLSFLAAIAGAPLACLGVQDFGQSGDVQDLYRHFGIDTETIVGAAVDVIG